MSKASSEFTASWRNDILNEEGVNFFRDITKLFGASQEVGMIASVHCYESSIPEAAVAREYMRLLALIPKNSSATRNPDVVDFLRKKGLPLHSVGKSILKDPEQAVDFVKKVAGKKPFIISDHGGYFAHAAHELCAAFDKAKLIGFSEYTHNGHERYKKHAAKVDRPIVSVAELGLKSPADREAGETVAHIVDHKLRETSGLKVANPGLVRVGIIGYGRLGESAAKAFSGLGVERIWVAETNKNKLLKAVREKYVPKTIEDVCAGCNVIISATGNGALKPHHYSMMRDGVYLATVTSPDDELDIDHLRKEKIINFLRNGNDIATYEIGSTGKKLNLIADGESANSLCNSGIGDPTLFLPQAAQMVANLHLIKNQDKLKPGLQELPEVLADRVSLEWLHHFYKYKEPPEHKNPWRGLDI